jgi:hypothetical protein
MPCQLSNFDDFTERGSVVTQISMKETIAEGNLADRERVELIVIKSGEKSLCFP